MDPPEPERKAASEKGRDASEQNNLSIAIHLKRNNLHLTVGEITCLLENYQSSPGLRKKIDLRLVV